MNDRTIPNGENRLLAALRPSDLSLLQPHLKRTVLEQGTLLQEQENRVERAYFPLSGMISLLAVMGDGQAIETAIVGREGTVGAMSGLGTWHAASRAVVTLPGTAWVIETSRLQDAVRQSEHLRNIILHYKETLLAQVHRRPGVTRSTTPRSVWLAGCCRREIALMTIGCHSHKICSHKCSGCDERLLQ
jgi:CRP-like cAMP-binding protein